MNGLKPFIIFRKDGYYNNLNDLIKLINFDNDDIIYNIYIDSDNDNRDCDYKTNFIDCDYMDNYQELRTNIVLTANGNDLLMIFDTYFKFNEDILYRDIDSTSYIVLKSKVEHLGLPILFTYLSTDNTSIDIIGDLDFFDHSDKVVGIVDVKDEFFNTHLVKKDDDIILHIIKFLFKIELVADDELPDISENDAQFYYNYVYLYNDTTSSFNDKLTEFTKICDSGLRNDGILCYLIMTKIFSEDEIKNNSIYQYILPDEPEQSLLYFTGNTNEIIKKYIILLDKNEKENFRSKLPDWISEEMIPEYIIDRELPTIVNKTELSDEHPIVKGYKSYYITGNKISYDNSYFRVLDKDFENIIPIEYKDKILIGSFNETYSIMSIVEDSIKNIITDKASNYKLHLFGNMVKFFSNYICLNLIRDNCYSIAVFQDKVFTPIGISKHFKIENPIGLMVEDNKLFIITKNNNQFSKNTVDLIEYFTNICKYNDIDSVYNINIKDRNNIKLSINGYNNIISEFSGLRFNADEDSLADVEFNFKNKIIKYNDSYYFHNKFVYLPENIDVCEKEYDICFYESHPILSELENKFKELQISKGTDFRKAKYCFILQSTLEALDSLKLSNIIENNTIIISMLTPEQLASNNFIKKYTTNPLLQKLFLFNIGMNENYIEFIVEKILLDEQYEKRQQFMVIDKNNMFKESNIYSVINRIKTNTFVTIKNNETNMTLMNKFKTRFFDSDSSYTSIINYAISKDFDLNIRYFNTPVPEKLRKLNIFGTEKSIMEDSSKFDLVIVSTLDDLSKIEINSVNVFFYVADINKMVIT